MLLATTDGIADYTVRHTLGIVVAAVPFIGSKYEEGIKSLRGQVHPDLPAVLERRCEECLRRLVAKARDRHANAIVGVRFDHREITDTWKDLYAYGTAVFIVPNTS